MTLRKSKDTPSNRELQVMSVLWERGSATVAEVREALNEWTEPEIAYTTVLTHLRSLIGKRWVRADARQRAYRYVPAVSREHARFVEIQRLRDVLYEGSRDLMLTELLKDRHLPERLLVRLRELLDDRLRKRRR